MAETLQKLRPDRELQCYFLRPTAAAALSATSATGFTISGSWREQFDWVVIEWNRDNTFEHPAFRNLPDGDLSGIVLTYDETRQNCIPIDSSLFPTVDWPSLRIWGEVNGVEDPNVVPYKVPLKPLAVPIEGSYQPATAIFHLQGTATEGDFVELAWGTEHATYQVILGDTIDTVAQRMVEAVNTSLTMQASRMGTQITLTYLGVGQTLATSTVGANGNRIGVYGNVSGAQTESWQPWFQQLSGGTSPSKWRVTIDFGALLGQNIPTNSVRKMRWTYSADLQSGAYQRSEFQVTISNWTVSGSNLTYKVAGPGSRRIEDTSPQLTYLGTWDVPTGNFSEGDPPYYDDG